MSLATLPAYKQSNKDVLVLIQSTYPGITKGYPFAYRIYATADEETDFIAEYVKKQGYKKIGLPAATLAAGVGDEIDRAAVLVALLRAAGVRADLALIKRGAEDLDPAIPTLGRFDHVLVRAELGGRDVWICLEAPFMPVGDLPHDDRARQVLVVSTATRKLAETPAYAPGHNTASEVRTYHLADAGPAAITEVTSETGAFAASRRRWVSTTGTDEVSELLTSYAEGEYAGTRSSHALAAPADLASPVALTLEVQGARSAETTRDSIEITLRAHDTFEKLPSELTEDDRAPRVTPYRWETPHTYTIENRLVVPDGFLPPPLPPPTREALGPATLTTAWSLDGTALVVRYHFDSGPVTLSPAQYTALAAAIADYRRGAHDDLVALHSTVWSPADAGQHPAAPAESRRLASARPHLSLHPQQRAYVYVNAGLGLAGQRTAREAVALAPLDAEAHFMLAWTLERDELGRFHGPGFDRAGAIAAYRRARALGPTHSGIAKDYADLLQRGVDGVPFERGADLPGAIAAWREVAALDGDVALHLATALFHAGQFDAVIGTLEPLDATPEITALTLAATAMLTDAVTAVARATDEDGAPSTVILTTAVEHLRTARHYDRARELAAASPAVVSSLGQVTGLASLRRIAPLPDRSGAPEDAVRGILELLVEGAGRARWAWDDATAKELRTTLRAPSLRDLVAQQGRTITRDLLLSTATFATTGGPAGPWRVQVESLGVDAVFYVVRTGGAARVIGASVGERTPHALFGVGRYASRQIAANQLDATTQLLAWILTDAPTARLELVWSASEVSRPALALAAAGLAGITDVRHAIPVLTACAGGSGQRRTRCDGLLAGVLYSSERWSALLAHGVAWGQREPAAVGPLSAQVSALRELGRGAETAALATPLGTRVDFEANALRFSIALATRDLPRLAALGALLTRQTPQPRLSNQVAWTLLVMGSDLPAALAHAMHAVGDDPATADDNALNTRAAILAELGETGRAWADARQAIRTGQRDPLTDGDLYVLGRIAEQLGERSTARAYYQRVTPKKWGVEPYQLAARRLATLGK